MNSASISSALGASPIDLSTQTITAPGASAVAAALANTFEANLVSGYQYGMRCNFQVYGITTASGGTFTSAAFSATAAAEPSGGIGDIFIGGYGAGGATTPYRTIPSKSGSGSSTVWSVSGGNFSSTGSNNAYIGQNDDSALQAAMARAEAIPSGGIELPRGVCPVSTALAYSESTGFVMVGQGRQVTKLLDREARQRDRHRDWHRHFHWQRVGCQRRRRADQP